MNITAKADPVYLPVQGVFSNVVYSGYDNGVFTDNSTTAPASTFIYNDTVGDGYVTTLYWGTGPEVPVGKYYSELSFYGGYAPFEDSSVPQFLGNIVYSNGSSNADTIIFGATLSFYINGVLLGSNQISITSTSNQYQGNFYLTQSQAQADADYINICGPGSQICATGIQAFESTEGMDGVPFSSPVVAELTGAYEVDPSLTLTGVDYVVGDGVVSDRAPPVIPGAPEPSTWVMLMAGFGGLGLLAHRKRNKLKTAGRQFVAEN